MYRHCPSCTRDLGTNEALEHFPVGRRLAYDLERGRLWVLCPRCRGWNLAPLEERWEAVEDAERAFETAAFGAGTEHIALGRLPDGTELVRIGRAKAPELAGWRYAKRMSARWRRAQWAGGIGTAAWMMGGPSSVGGLLGWPVILAGVTGWLAWDWTRSRARRIEVPRGSAGPRVVTRRQLRYLHLVPSPIEDPREEGDPADGFHPWGLEVRAPGHRPLAIPPELRSRALRLSLLDLNRQIGRPAHVQKALDRVAEAGDPARLAGLAARDLAGDRPWGVHVGWPFGDLTALRRADPVLRLAVEIAANEEVERVALEGELYRLELEWREAEELANISDSLLTPDWVRRRIQGWRGGRPNGDP